MWFDGFCVLCGAGLICLCLFLSSNFEFECRFALPNQPLRKLRPELFVNEENVIDAFNCEQADPDEV